MKYYCKTHGDWNAFVASGCPQCVAEMQADLALYREFVQAFDSWCDSNGEDGAYGKMLTKREALP